MSLFARNNQARELGFDLYEGRDASDPQRTWDEYCGFLGLSLDDYVHIQRRLMEEQLVLWCPSGIGKSILKGKKPASIEEFRECVPLTTYDDYADILLARREDMLPLPAVTWVETTWEGGKRPIKLAPYTQGILDSFKRNGKAIIMLASATDWAQYRIGTNVLSGLAPLPYLTGLMGIILDQEFHFRFMPPHKTTTTMGFSQRMKYGFKMALSSGVDYFLTMGSVGSFMSKKLAGAVASGASMGSSHAKAGASADAGAGAATVAESKSGKSVPSLAMARRVLKARRKAAREGRELLPKDLFDLRGFVIAGTDNACYKDELEQQWGVRPMELFAGTECGLVGTETWNRTSLYFFPDACFYEFLPEEFVRSTGKNLPTLTIDQVQAGELYELVITSLKGGAFARYRTGDMYRCAGIGSAADHSTLPRFVYVDRVPGVIDIAGFTRITENSIKEVVALSRLPIVGWCAAKEYEKQTRHPFLHMYIELDPHALESLAVSEAIIRSHLEIYFKYLDTDYDSLRTILEMEPLQITFLQTGSFAAYEKREGAPIDAINPSQRQILQLRGIMATDWPYVHESQAMGL